MELNQRIARSAAAQDEVAALVSSIPDAAFSQPSGLPDWSIANVVAHLVGNCAAQARQLEYARDGNQIEVYTGGQDARADGIERLAERPPGELRDELDRQHDRYTAVAQSVDQSWSGNAVAYRSGTVLDVINGRWMESLVHAVDLAQPHFTCQRWDRDFSELLINFLLERLPADREVRLSATDTDLDLAIGRGARVLIAAPIADIAGFLADRGPVLNPTIALGPYPRGSTRR